MTRKRYYHLAWKVKNPRARKFNQWHEVIRTRLPKGLKHWVGNTLLAVRCEDLWERKIVATNFDLKDSVEFLGRKWPMRKATLKRIHKIVSGSAKKSRRKQEAKQADKMPHLLAMEKLWFSRAKRAVNKSLKYRSAIRQLEKKERGRTLCEVFIEEEDSKRKAEIGL